MKLVTSNSLYCPAEVPLSNATHLNSSNEENRSESLPQKKRKGGGWEREEVEDERRGRREAAASPLCYLSPLACFFSLFFSFSRSASFFTFLLFSPLSLLASLLVCIPSLFLFSSANRLECLPRGGLIKELLGFDAWRPEEGGGWALPAEDIT